MQKWKIKAAVQKVLSLLPNSQFWNSFFQKFVTRRYSLSERVFKVKLTRCNELLEQARHAVGRPSENFTVLELGTGWHPVLAIGMYLCGASKIWSVDIESLMTTDNVRSTVEFFVQYAQSGRLLELLPSAVEHRVTALQENVGSLPESATGKAMLEALNIESVVSDARTLDLAPGSVDFFISACVFEHIPQDVLKDIFIKFHEIAAADAVMNHSVDLSDHYSHFDRSISGFNFLQYSSREWRRYNNQLHYQNRLRIDDYRKLHQETGFRIAAELDKQGDPAELESIQLAAEFQQYPQEELLICSSRLISVPIQEAEQE
ncbi:MAG TPA: class I SAM-dependent methyltransferase [Thermoguttaceae bacterium]|nr:class I SAM-dependent methyltransferase [Thermoguttaceae bacterium]